MKKKFVVYCLNQFKKKRDVSSSDERIVSYSLEALYSLITKMLVVVIIAFFIGTLKETLWIILFYSILRTFSFGIHASSNLKCWISTLTMYIVIPLLIKYLYFPINYYYLIFILSSIIIIVFSPADTPKRPLIKEDKRFRNKAFVSITLCVFLSISFMISNELILNSLLFAIIVQAVCVNPLTYKLTNTQFNNYKYYKKRV